LPSLNDQVSEMLDLVERKKFGDSKLEPLGDVAINSNFVYQVRERKVLQMAPDMAAITSGDPKLLKENSEIRRSI
jgi:hypothetical protein